MIWWRGLRGKLCGKRLTRRAFWRGILDARTGSFGFTFTADERVERRLSAGHSAFAEGRE